MPSPPDYQPFPTDSFLIHLVALLSVYELGPSPAPLPHYNGPTDWQTEAILRSLSAVARRMYTAEESLSSIKASQNWQTVNGPDTKKRRSFGPLSPNESPSSLSPLPNGTSSSARSGGGGGVTFTATSATTSSSDDVDISGTRTTAQEHVRPAARPPSPMKISLDGIPDPESLFSNPNVSISTSAPSTTQADHAACPTCGRAITDSISMARISAFNGTSSGSPLVVPPGPLATAAFESGMSAVEELRLLKAQVQDVARVCNAVARGDLSQKITVPVQGVVMVQLKDVINTMVRVNSFVHF
jgi:osomolarity two-component system sensor histidine kinase NIK1